MSRITSLMICDKNRPYIWLGKPGVAILQVSVDFVDAFMPQKVRVFFAALLREPAG